MQTGAGFDLCSPQDRAAGHPQVLPTAGPRLRKSHNCWSWQDWDLFYLQRQGTQAGKDVSEVLSGLPPAPLLRTAHTSYFGLGSLSPSQTAELEASQ